MSELETSNEVRSWDAPIVYVSIAILPKGYAPIVYVSLHLLLVLSQPSVVLTHASTLKSRDAHLSSNPLYNICE